MAEKLTQAGVRSEAIHGNKRKPPARALEGFKQGRFRVLVATGRGRARTGCRRHHAGHQLRSTHGTRNMRTAWPHGRAGMEVSPIPSAAPERSLLRQIERLLASFRRFWITVPLRKPSIPNSGPRILAAKRGGRRPGKFKGNHQQPSRKTRRR